MNKNKCIVEMYKTLDEIRKKIQKGDMSAFRHGRVGGQDQFAGMSPFERSLAILENEFDEEIWYAFKNVEGV